MDRLGHGRALARDGQGADHGRQVGSQRWLKQFIGRKSGEKLVYGEDIDGISGATVSAKSMTLAVSNVLESIKVLQDHNIL